MRVRLSKVARWSASHRARGALVAVGALGAAGVLATAALASGATSASTNWSTVQSASAGGGMNALIAEAKKEGTLNVIALPNNWANYGTESGNPKCANCMVHSGYEASAVHDTFGSLRGFLGTVRATFSSKYKDDEALAMLNEEVRAVRAYDPLVQIGNVES